MLISCKFAHWFAEDFYDSGTAVRAGFAVHDRSERSDALKMMQEEVYAVSDDVRHEAALSSSDDFQPPLPTKTSTMRSAHGYEQIDIEEQPSVELGSEPWIHGKITMKDAERVIRSGDVEVGTFLFRRKDADSPMPLALSVFNGVKTEHFLVEADDHGCLMVNRTKLQRDCHTADELVAHLRTVADVIPVPLATCRAANQ